MTVFHRRDDPLSLTELIAFEFDGLLQRLTHDVWVPAGIVQDPELRCAALGRPPRDRVAVSHAAAHWIWWGSDSGRAPALVEYTTLARRRQRTAQSGWTIYERDVPPAERVDVSGVPVTSPQRTLFDLLRHAAASEDPDRAAHGHFARVPQADLRAFVIWLDRSERRPYIAVVSELALRTVGQRRSSRTDPQRLTR